MPYPTKLSAVLNNCALHAFVPEITEEIDNYAKSIDHRNAHTPYYEKLKDAFVNYYQLPAPFHFKQFSDLLHSYNPHDRQIIMGPVLREFMRETAAQSSLREFVETATNSDLADAEQAVKLTEEALTAAIDAAKKVKKDEATELIRQKHLAVRIAQDRFEAAYQAANEMKSDPRQHYLSSITEIGHGKARFRTMSPVEAHHFIGNPLGISLTFHRDKTSYSLNAERPIASINMHHQGSKQEPGGHWELTDKAQGSIDYLEKTEFEDFLPLLGENPHVNEAGLQLLSEHVRLRAQKVQAQDPAYQELRNTANAIEKFLFNVERVPAHIAKELLGNAVSKPVADFIQEYKPDFEVTASEAKHAMNDPEVGRRLKMPPEEFLQEARAVKKAHEKEESHLERQDELIKLEKSLNAAEKTQYVSTITAFSKPDSEAKTSPETMTRYKLNIATLIKERDKVFSQGAKLKTEKKDTDEEMATELQISEFKKAGL